MTQYTHEKWKGTTGGRGWMQRSLIAMYRHFGLGFLYAFMCTQVPIYALINIKSFGHTYRFYRLRLKCSAWRSFVNVLKSYFTFGKIIVDRFAVYGGKRFETKTEGFEFLQQLFDSEPGFMQLSSHVGNYELAGYTFEAGKHMNTLVFSGETDTVMENRQRVFGRNNISMVPVADDMSHVFTLSNALANGEIVSMPADRIFGSSKCVECDFFGAKAKFPIGPFAFAVQRQVSVVALFMMKEARNVYRMIVVPIVAEVEGLNARQSMQLLAQGFAKELEKVVRRYPLQWFNYYDFWQNKE